MLALVNAVNAEPKAFGGLRGDFSPLSFLSWTNVTRVTWFAGFVVDEEQIAYVVY
jgi:hypothetical protein